MRKREQRGFTLLEVLVATAIMGLTIAGVMSGLASATRNAARITEYDRAAILARLKMDELLANEATPRDIPVQGAYSLSESGGVPAGWSARVTPFESMGGPLAPGTWVVDRIELTVWWMDGEVRRSFTMEGIRRAQIPVPGAPR